MVTYHDTVVQIGDPVLRTVAQPVPISDISTPKIQRIIMDMLAVLEKEEDGAALAAPQIGVPLRIFVLAQKVFGPGSSHRAASNDSHLVFINPEITRRSRRQAPLEEGCLSVRGRYGTINRHQRVTVRAYDERGMQFVRGASGLLAQAFQHECDHLNGTLFVDHAFETWDVKKHSDREP